MTYANTIEAAAIQRALDRYHWQEEAAARREANVNHQAQWIADEVIAPTPDCAHRRAAYIEEIIDGEGFVHLLGDLLDDLKAGINPTETLRRSVSSWAQTVAEYEDERDEA